MKLQVVYGVIMALTVVMLTVAGWVIWRDNRVLARAKEMMTSFDGTRNIETAMVDRKTTQSWRRMNTDEKGSVVEVWLKWHDKSYVDAAQAAGLLQAVETTAVRGKPAPKAKLVAKSGDADVLMILPEDYLRIEFFVPADANAPAKITSGEVFDRHKQVKLVKGKEAILSAENVCSVLYTGYFLNCPVAPKK